MKIVMLCEFFDRKLEFQENLLVKYYRKQGHEVTVVTSLFESVFDYYADRAPQGRARREEECDGARIIRLPFRFNLLNRIRPFVSVREILEEAEPDLVFVHDIIPNLDECVDYVKAHPRARMIMDYHADYSNSGKNWLSLRVLHGVLRKRYLDRARPYLDRIFPIVPAGFDFLHEIYQVPFEEMELLPLGTDLDYGASIRSERVGLTIRERLGIARTDLTVFTGGKLTPNRRTEHLIDAVRDLSRADIHLIVVGESPQEHAEYGAMLRSIADGNSNIHFVGWQDKRGIYSHMDASDIAIFPGGQSVLWQQAIGMGLPLALVEYSEQTRRRQDTSYLNRYENVIIMESGNTANEIIFWLSRFSDDRRLLDKMSEGARRTSQEILDYDKIVETTLRFCMERANNTALADGLKHVQS